MTRTLKSCGLAMALVWLLAACSESRYRAYEGHVCSTSSRDPIQHSCDRTFADLICISTYKVATTDAYVCRVACTTQSDCRAAGLVCCAGKAPPNIYGATRGCTVREKCETDPAALLQPTGGGRDASADGASNMSDTGAMAPDAPAVDPDAPAVVPDAAGSEDVLNTNISPSSGNDVDSEGA